MSLPLPSNLSPCASSLQISTNCLELCGVCIDRRHSTTDCHYSLAAWEGAFSAVVSSVTPQHTVLPHYVTDRDKRQRKTRWSMPLSCSVKQLGAGKQQNWRFLKNRLMNLCRRVSRLTRPTLNLVYQGKYKKRHCNLQRKQILEPCVLYNSVFVLRLDTCNTL